MGKPPNLDHTPSMLARVIDPKRLSNRQHKRMADELIRATRAAQSVARMRVAGTVIIGSLGIAGWMWQKAKKPNASPNEKR